MLNVIILIVIMLNVDMVSVVMLSVIAPTSLTKHEHSQMPQFTLTV